MVRISIHEGLFQYGNMGAEQMPVRGNFISSMDYGVFGSVRGIHYDN